MIVVRVFEEFEGETILEIQDPVPLEALVMIFYVQRSLQRLALLVLHPSTKEIDPPW